jgi:hypothetical protein
VQLPLTVAEQLPEHEAQLPLTAAAHEPTHVAEQEVVQSTQPFCAMAIHLSCSMSFSVTICQAAVMSL